MKRRSVFVLIFLLPLYGLAQTYQFSNYGLDEGLFDKFTYTLNQDPQGFLWIGTGAGLCRFDGNEFENDFKGDSITTSIAHSSLLDSRGRLWFGHENGLLSVYRDGAFRLIAPSDHHRSKITAIRESKSGNILVLCQQSGLLVLDRDLKIIYERDPENPEDPFSGKFLYDMQESSDGTLLVATQDGVSLYRYDEDLKIYIHTGVLPGLQYLGVQELVGALNQNEYWAGTEDEGLFRITGEGFDPAGYRVEKIGQGQGIEYASIASIVFDGDRRVWINSLSEGIYRFDLDENGNLGNSLLFSQKNGLTSAYINHIFVDEEGNQWFSTPGNGLTVLRDQAFTFYSIWKEEGYSDVTAVFADGELRWFGGEGRIASVRGSLSGDAGGAYSYLGRSNGLPDDYITALYTDKQHNLYIGTRNTGLYWKRAGTSGIIPLLQSRNSLENSIRAIDGNDTVLYLATNSGVCILNPLTGKYSFRTTANGLPHNLINDLLVGRNGEVWIATRSSGLYSISSERHIPVADRPNVEYVTLAEGEDGVIWAGTAGDGVFKFDLNRESQEYYSADRGLKSNNTYALTADPRGKIWAGHRMGLSAIHPGRKTVRSFGRESGFKSDVNQNAVAISSDGKMLFGSTGGVIEYDAYQAREDTAAPRLSIKSIEINGDPYSPDEAIRLKYGKYRIRIEFVGINLINPEQVSYQYKLDNFDEEWSRASNLSFAYYGRVEDGNYTFMLKACDGNGNCSPEPLTFDLSVRIPVWKAWWFIFALVMLVLTVIFAVFKIRERNQKAIQEYLQRQLDERTREVVQQKEEIEVKNRDITDSLNYAQRIQASILPPIKKLHDAFTGSFVFYQPRDIVSGDFYWYEKVDENRFMVVCADSTGHGVPGAFMSMIGTTLIKDICLRSGITKPSQVLTTLDNEVREALNQNVETSGSNDGMDIIVAEVDMRTNKFTVSSAMRPVIIYSGGEQIYVKGSRSSIGGQLDEDRVEKDFIDQEFMLNKGDIIYMFSDGYPDQFGGPLGRKFKMVRLKNLLRDIHDKPMDEQYNYIKSNFFLWKEDLEQVDDVLFMGIRI
ncbi:MAG: two-component regulator propeller domain-containing protein [Bacteroidales bacterium]|nr:two-component regulator propeller domain-containing protein [Bacteroidales bacterium]